MSKKYKLTKETKTIQGKSGPVTLHRIRALSTFGDIQKGELGGWIESDKNLSQDGEAFVYEESQVYGNAHVEGNAEIRGNAKVFENARVYGNAHVYDDVKVYGNARVSDRAWIQDNAQIYGNAQVDGQANIRGEAKVYGDAQVQEKARIYDNAEVYGHAYVSGDVEIYGNAWVGENSFVYDFAKVSGTAKVIGKASVYNNARVTDNAVIRYQASIFERAKISENAEISGNAQVCGDARVFGNAKINDNVKIYHDAQVYGNAQVSGDVKVSGFETVYEQDNPSASIQKSSLEGWHWKNYEDSASLCMPDGNRVVSMDYHTKEVAYYNYNKLTDGRPFQEEWTLPCGVNASVEEVRETIINDFRESSLRYLPAEMRPQLSNEPLMKQFADIPQHYVESPETQRERIREERMQIRQDIRANGFKANSTLVANIEHLNEITGKRNALQDVKELAKDTNISAEAKEVVGEIVDNLQQQELKMPAPEPPAVEPA